MQSEFRLPSPIGIARREALYLLSEDRAGRRSEPPRRRRRRARRSVSGKSRRIISGAAFPHPGHPACATAAESCSMPAAASFDPDTGEPGFYRGRAPGRVGALQSGRRRSDDRRAGARHPAATCSPRCRRGSPALVKREGCELPGDSRRCCWPREPAGAGAELVVSARNGSDSTTEGPVLSRRRKKNRAGKSRPASVDYRPEMDFTCPGTSFW